MSEGSNGDRSRTDGNAETDPGAGEAGPGRFVLSDGGQILPEAPRSDGGDPDDEKEVVGAERVVAERSVDDVFAEFEEDTPEEVMAADDDPTPAANEIVVEGDVEGLLGDLSEVDPEPAGAPERTVEAGGVETVVESEEQLFDEPGEGGPKRVVADSSVDEVFERFEEDTPEEVMAADDASLESDPRAPPAGEGQAAFDERTWDLDTVDLTPREVTETETESEAGPAPDSEAAQQEVEGLLGDLSSVEVEADETDGVESLLGDLSEVDVEDAPGPADPTDAEAETAPTVLDPEELGATGFEWLGEDQPLLESTGEDTHRAVGESDVDAVFEEFEEATPEEVMSDAAVGVSATTLYAEHAGERSPGAARASASTPTVEGWGAGGAGAATGVSATTMYDEMAPDSPVAFRPGVDSGEDGIDLGEVSVNRDGTVSGDADVDAVFERFEEDSPEEVMAADEQPLAEDPLVPSAGEGQGEFDDQTWDLAAVDLEGSAPAPEPDREQSTASDDEPVESLLGDLSDVDIDTEAGGVAAGTDLGHDSPGVGAFVDDPDDAFERTDDVHQVVGESDVDAFFERFEEDSPEEVATPDRQTATRDPDRSTTTTTGESKDLSEGLDFEELGVDAALDDVADRTSTGAQSGQTTGAGDATEAGNGIVDDASHRGTTAGAPASTSERVSKTLSASDDPTAAGAGEADAGDAPMFPGAVEDESDDDGASRLDAVREAVAKIGARIRNLI